MKKFVLPLISLLVVAGTIGLVLVSPASNPYPNPSSADYAMTLKGAAVQKIDPHEYLAARNLAQGIESRKSGGTAAEFDALMGVLSSKTWQIREGAIGALTHFSGDLQQKAFQKLKDIGQTDPDPGARVIAAICLYNHHDVASAVAIARANIADPNLVDKMRMTYQDIIDGKDLRHP